MYRQEYMEEGRERRGLGCGKRVRLIVLGELVAYVGALTRRVEGTRLRPCMHSE
jgi:hypothetical protein